MRVGKQSRRLCHIKKASIDTYFETATEGKSSNFDKMSDFLEENPLIYLAELTEALHAIVKGKRDIASLDDMIRPIIQRTSFEWKDVPAKSRSREFEMLGKSAYLEAFRAKSYRQKLLKSTSAGHLRKRLCDAMASETDSIMRGGKPVFEWSFIDSIKLENLDGIPLADLSRLSTEMEEFLAKQLPDVQWQELEKFVKSASANPTFLLDRNTPGVLEANVAKALKELILVWHSEVFNFWLIYV